MASPFNQTRRMQWVVASLIRSSLVFGAILLANTAGAQNPCEGGRGTCDALLINKGRPWDYQVGVNATPRALNVRAPDPQEQSVVDAAKRIFNASSIRAFALLHGDKVIHASWKDGVPQDALFYGLSVGKTVTAIAAGQAVCRNLITLESKVGNILPEFSATDMGGASLKDLLTMSSGTWVGFRDSNVATPEQFREIWSGQMTIKDLMLTPKVHTAEKDPSGRPLQPGTAFAYRNSDPEMVALMVSRVVGMHFSDWVEQSVLKPASIAGPAIMRTDRHHFAFASGALQMTLGDWARFAVWVRESYDEETCLGKFLREAAKPQIATRGPNGPFNLFSHYGFFTWVEHRLVPNSFYAHGVGGQIVAWNKRNKRILVAFSNDAPANDLGNLYRDWSRLP